MSKRFCKGTKNRKYKARLLSRLSIVMTAVIFVVAIVSICTSGHAAQNDTAAETTQATTYATEPETTATEPPTAPQPTETEATETTVAAYTYFDCPLSEDLQIFIFELCEEKQIDPAIIVAMCWKESTYNPGAIGDGGSSYGIMQVQPRWHRERMERLGCTDLLDPYQNIMVGVDYLVENLERYGDMAKALTAYNRGIYNGTITWYATDVLAKAESLGVKE